MIPFLRGFDLAFSYMGIVIQKVRVSRLRPILDELGLVE